MKQRFEKFEEAYIRLRSLEHRVFSVEQIRELPYLTDTSNPNYNEWKYRADTFDRFQKYFLSYLPTNVLDLACGNGWMINRLYREDVNFVGVEVNIHELNQAKDLLNSKRNVDFIAGDIFELKLNTLFDCIFISGAIQYFDPFDKIIDHLLSLLNPGGSVHILDSPIYENQESAEKAKLRSVDYYNNANVGEMSEYYFHHTWDKFKPYTYKVRFDPNQMVHKLGRKIGKPYSPFYWVQIVKANNKVR